MNYTLRVKYEKKFLQGALTGLTVPVQVGFPTLKAAQEYINHFSGNKQKQFSDCITHNTWVLVGTPCIERVVDVPESK